MSCSRYLLKDWINFCFLYLVILALITFFSVMFCAPVRLLLLDTRIRSDMDQHLERWDHNKNRHDSSKKEFGPCRHVPRSAILKLIDLLQKISTVFLTSNYLVIVGVPLSNNRYHVLRCPNGTYRVYKVEIGHEEILLWIP